jgi:hypothetical protein
MAQVSAVRQIQAHQPIMGFHDGLIDLQIGGTAREWLDIDSPFLRIKAKGCQSAALAQGLDGINVLISTVISGSWISLRVLVGHWRAECVKNGA